MQTLPDKIIMFDGECVMCNNVVSFILKNNKKQNLFFTSLQSNTAKEILKNYDTDEELNSVLYKNGFVLFSKSEAALQICKELNAPYKWLYVFRHMNFTLRENIYNYIAKNRYKWFGKKDTCMLPTAAIKHRFI
jgi:predicted DCC family thiol-disulfide oxidoreductase YuxK